MNHNIVCQQAGNYFENGYNCAESVATAAAMAFDPECNCLPAAASAFGGGVGSSRQELCGALSGACIAIGILAGRKGYNDDLTAKAMARDIREAMLAEYGTVQCQALVDQFGDEKRREKCKAVVEHLTRLVMDRLERMDEFKSK